MSSSPPDAPASASLLAPEAPYRGLTPYLEEDAALYFGREDDCGVVIDNLLASRLTLLYGPSGVGKTSLLRAGVTHELLGMSRQNLASYGSPEFVVVYFNQWSGDPLPALARCVHASVASVLGRAADGPPAGSAPLADTLNRWTAELNSDLLIILDQFEEYFLYHPDDGGEDSFAAQFPDAVNRAGLRASFLVSIREDALARLDRFKGPLPHLFDNYLRMRHLELPAAREAIERPLEAYNRLVAPEVPFTAEPELVRLVLEQVQIGKVRLLATGRGTVERETGAAVSDPRIETPYLQLVLMRLWREEIATGSHTLRAGTLQRLGGAERIVRAHLDEALRALPGPQQDVAAGIFHHLVTPSGTKVAHTARDLALYADLPEDEVAVVLEALSRGDVRILRPVPRTSGELDADPAYEIFHDVLAPAVLGWRTRHTEARRTEARLAATVERSAADKRAAEARARHYRQLLKRVSVVAMALLLILMSAVAYLATRDLRVAVEARKSTHSRELAATALAQIANPAASLRLAREALEEDPTPEATSALRRAVSEPGFRVAYRGHAGWVMSARPSPSGRQVLTSSLDGTVRVWDAATGRQLARLDTDKAPSYFAGRPEFNRDGTLALVSTLAGTVQVWPWQGGQPTVVSSGRGARRAAFSPDGDRVVTGHRNGTTQVRAWRTGRSATLLPGSGKAQVSAVAFNPDGRLVAAGDEDGTVRLWNLSRPDRPVTLKAHEYAVNTLAFDGKGRLLLTASDDGTSKLFAVPSGRAVSTLTGSGDPMLTAAFSPDGKLAVTASFDKTARVFTVPGGRPAAMLRGHIDEVLQANFSPNSQLVATASPDGTGAVWDAHTGRKLVDLRGHEGPLFTVAFTPSGKSLITASGDRTARLWELPGGQVFQGHRGPLNDAVYSPDGRLVATAAEDGRARLFNAATGRVVEVLDGGDEAVTSVAFSPDGARLITAGLTADFAGVTRTWEVAEPNRGKVFRRDAEEILSAEFSSDGRLVSSTTASQTLISDARTGRPLVRIELPAAERDANPFVQILASRLSPDDRWVATTHYDNSSRLWDAKTGNLHRALQGHTGIVYTATFSADSRMVVTASGDRTARVWDSQTGNQLHVLIGPSIQLHSAAFSPDMRWVVGGAIDGSLWIWELATGQLAAVLHPHTGIVRSVGFSPDGRFVLSASDDQTARSSTCESCRPFEELLALARQRERLATGSS